MNFHSITFWNVFTIRNQIKRNKINVCNILFQQLFQQLKKTFKTIILLLIDIILLLYLKKINIKPGAICIQQIKNVIFKQKYNLRSDTPTIIYLLLVRTLTSCLLSFNNYFFPKTEGIYRGPCEFNPHGLRQVPSAVDRPSSRCVRTFWMVAVERPSLMRTYFLNGPLSVN